MDTENGGICKRSEFWFRLAVNVNCNRTRV